MEDPETFELIVSEYRDKVFRLALSMTRNYGQAEEIAQDVFIRVWRALPSFRRESSISTWIYTIARNTCLTALRRIAARPALSLEEPRVRRAAEERHAAPARPNAPDLDALLDDLPEKHRQVLMLFYMQEKSYQEVANILDLPMGTVKTYLHRARKELAAAALRSRIREGER